MFGPENTPGRIIAQCAASQARHDAQIISWALSEIFESAACPWLLGLGIEDRVIETWKVHRASCHVPTGAMFNVYCSNLRLHDTFLARLSFL
jgi:hypothetical protein